MDFEKMAGDFWMKDLRNMVVYGGITYAHITLAQLIYFGRLSAVAGAGAMHEADKRWIAAACPGDSEPDPAQVVREAK
jgi:hypothetical protein